MQAGAAAAGPATGADPAADAISAPPPDSGVNLFSTTAQSEANPADTLATPAATGDTTQATATGTGTINATPAASPASPSVPTPTGPATTAAPSDLPTPPTTPGNVGAVDPATGQVITQGMAINPTTGQLEDVNSGSGSGILSSILGFAKNNSLVTYGALQAGGSLLSGLTSTLTPAQVAALNAQANANNAAAALTQQQTANLAMPKSVASSAPVTGKPQTLAPLPPTPPAGGLINNPPAQQAQVTGGPLMNQAA